MVEALELALLLLGGGSAPPRDAAVARLLLLLEDLVCELLAALLELLLAALVVRGRLLERLAHLVELRLVDLLPVLRAASWRGRAARRAPGRACRSERLARGLRELGLLHLLADLLELRPRAPSCRPRCPSRSLCSSACIRRNASVRSRRLFGEVVDELVELRDRGLRVVALVLLLQLLEEVLHVVEVVGRHLDWIDRLGLRRGHVRHRHLEEPGRPPAHPRDRTTPPVALRDMHADRRPRSHLGCRGDGVLDRRVHERRPVRRRGLRRMRARSPGDRASRESDRVRAPPRARAAATTRRRRWPAQCPTPPAPGGAAPATRRLHVASGGRRRRWRRGGRRRAPSHPHGAPGRAGYAAPHASRADESARSPAGRVLIRPGCDVRQPRKFPRAVRDHSSVANGAPLRAYAGARYGIPDVIRSDGRNDRSPGVRGEPGSDDESCDDGRHRSEPHDGPPAGRSARDHARRRR